MNILKLYKFIANQKSVSKKILYFLFSIFFYVFDNKKKLKTKDAFTKDDVYPLF